MRHDPALQEAFDANRRAIALANDQASPLDIVQREVVSTAIKIRDARRAGVPVAVRSHTAALFALLRVRKELRAAA